MSSEEDDSFAEIYRSYKISTDYFLDWLWSQHEGLIPKPAKVPRTTKGMLLAAKALAQTLKKNKQRIPTDVINSLGDAIMKRWEAVFLYEQLGRDDKNHEIFIRRLEQTFSILAPFTARSPAPAAVATNTEKSPPVNAFASLATLADELDDSLNPPCTVSGSTLLQPQNGLDQSRGPTPETTPLKCMLEDDERTMRMEMVGMLRHLKEARSEVKQYWIDAAKGILPIPLARLFTNETFRELQKFFEGKCLGSSRCFESHCERVQKFFTDPWEPLYEIHILSAIRFCIISQAVNSHHTVSEFHEDFAKGLEVNPSIAHDFKPQERSPLIPLRYLPTEVPESDGDTDVPEHRAVIEIFKHIRRDVNEGRGIQGLETLCRVGGFSERPFTSERILPLALNNIRDPHAPASLELVLCMDIFLSSYEGFLWADDKYNKQNCRLQTLRLARDIQKSVLSAIFSLQKLSRDAKHSNCYLSYQKELHDALDTYLCEKAFDVYHQAPWTAGGHMTEILFKDGNRGETLCFRTHFVPCTLHLYNALTRSAFGMKKIPLMEDLCDLLVGNVFLGSRPTKKFFSSYRKALLFEIRNDTLGSWYLRQSNPTIMVVPTHSVFRHESLKQNEWTTSVLEEFRGRLPIARLDMFRMFTLCVEILERLSVLTPEDHNEGGIKFDIARNTHVMVDVLLGLIDQLSGSRRKEKELRDSAFAIAADMAFAIEVDQNAKLEQYLWNV
ncbi:hypothetical protein K4K56_002724 [Colletotrichum sp. SAR 10_98]|nr:hypothetical protein K4K56_002724 [Colletotrichum sp. SAR 10_98]